MPDVGLQYLRSGISNKIVFVIFIVAFFYTVSLFIAPLTLDPGTVEGLDGAANRIVYNEEWRDLPFYHRAVYTFGDLNCHQKHGRSYSLNGNQMPVCARDVGIFIGASMGLLLMSFTKSCRDLKDTLLDMINLDLSMSKKKKVALLVILGAIFALPLILDGSIQLVTGYESFNEFRTFTGLLFGFGFSVFISAMILSAPTPKEY